jgi:uncharacterized protein
LLEDLPLQHRELGKTGIHVSRLCFGTLVMGPLQRGLSPDEGGALLADAYRAGVNFIDTAELYGTYAHIRASVRQSGITPVIATKSYAWSADGAKRSVEKALLETGFPFLDIFLLHEQESEHTLRGHAEALEALLEMKRQGIVRAVGVSTHHAGCVRACADMPEIDVIHPIINRAGLGICDGTADDMLAALEAAHRAGKGLYGMKVFGGGNLLAEYPACLQFALDIPWLHAVAIGMQHRDELYANLAAFEAWESGAAIRNASVTFPDDSDGIRNPSAAGRVPVAKALHVDFWCEGCGRCCERCGHGALSISGGKVVPDPGRCVLCGYCAAVCPAFALKVY